MNPNFFNKYYFCKAVNVDDFVNNSANYSTIVTATTAYVKNLFAQ